MGQQTEGIRLEKGEVGFRVGVGFRFRFRFSRSDPVCAPAYFNQVRSLASIYRRKRKREPASETPLPIQPTAARAVTRGDAAKADRLAARRGSPGSLTDALETKESGEQGPVPNKRTEIEAAAAELVGGSTTTGSEGKQQGKTAAAAAAADGSTCLTCCTHYKHHVASSSLPANPRLASGGGCSSFL
jgi:hypothetical protein